MRPIDICVQLNSFLAQGMADQFVEAFEHHKTEEINGRTILGPASKQQMISPGGVSFDEYIELLDTNSYSAVFFDSALVSIQCYFDGNDIQAHRYLYIPCPIGKALTRGRPSEISLADWLRNSDPKELKRSFHSSGNLRFDYTVDVPADTEDPHPLSHFTFGASTCRIPVRAPLSPSGFLEFLFENYYRSYQERWRTFAPHLNCGGIGDTLSAEDSAKHHLNWA